MVCLMFEFSTWSLNTHQHCTIGTFVTKVFRSADYNNLLWVFNQLFEKVEATKPPSSRNVSAEIFVVCRGFKAPKKIDPKLLDPRFVFKEMEELVEGKSMVINDLFKPDKRTRHREGYAEGDYTLHSSVSATEFVECDDPIKILASCHEIKFGRDDKSIQDLSETTNEIVECCKDLKVLGKGDFKILIKWRLRTRLSLGLDEEKKTPEAKEPEPEEEKEIDIEEELENLTNAEKKKLKKAKKKAAEKHRKEMERIQLKMITPVDIGLEQVQAEPLFSTAKENIAKNIDDEADMDDELEIVSAFDSNSEAGPSEAESSDDDFLDSDEEEIARAARLERAVDAAYDEYRSRIESKDPKARVKKMKKNKLAEEEEFTGCKAQDSSDESEGEQSQADDSESSDSSESSESESESEVEEMDQEEEMEVEEYSESENDVEDMEIEKPSPKQQKQQKLSATAAMFFDQPLFKNALDLLPSQNEITTITSKQAKTAAQTSQKKRKAETNKEKLTKQRKLEKMEEESSSNEIAVVPVENDDSGLPGNHYCHLSFLG
jgi:AdoMet-dependent rRNA methyltransferase SPB1